jgi:O-antigen/teichoic acid export membrane protein
LFALSSGLARRYAHLDEHNALARLIRGTSWVLIGTVFSQLITLAISIVLARTLGIEAFGQYALINSTLAAMTSLVGVGLGQTATKYLSEYHLENPSHAGNVLLQTRILSICLSAIGCAFVWFFANLIAARILVQPDLHTAVKSASLLLAVTAFTAMQNGALAGFAAFSSIAGVSILRACSHAMIVYPLTNKWALAGAIWATTVSLIVSAVAAEVLLFKCCRRHSVSATSWRSAPAWRAIRDYSIPAILSGSITSIATAMALRRVGLGANGLTELAVFNAANQWRIALLFFPGLLGQVLMPLLSSLQGVTAKRVKLKMMKVAIIANTVAGVATFFLVYFFSGVILSAYGKTFEGRQDVMLVLLLSTILLAAQTPIGNLISSSTKMWVGFAYNVAWSLCLVLSTNYLVDLGWGAQSLSTAYLISYALHAIWTGWYAYSLLQRETSSTLEK